MPNIQKIAKSYTINYSCISNNREIDTKLTKILKNDIAEIIEVKIDPKNIYILS